MKYTKLSLIAMAAATLFTACGSKTDETANAPKADPVVSVVTAQAEDINITNTYTSNIEPFATNNIVSQSAGRIVSINAEVGQQVRKGQVMARMDDVNLAKTRLQIVNDSIELSRLTELYNLGAVAQADYDMAKLSLNLARKTYSNLAENTVLRSPINGVVTARNYDKGDMYSMAQPIFVVQQIAPVKMLINISESLSPKSTKVWSSTLLWKPILTKCSRGRSTSSILPSTRVPTPSLSKSLWITKTRNCVLACSPA